MSGCVVVAEDDPAQSRILRLYLEREGYTVVQAADGPAALAAVREHQPSLLLLDLMMPVLDGRDVCRMVRTESDVPIVMLTARGAEDDVLTGLDLGADDYIVKPYRPRELMARLRAVLRRNQPPGDEPPPLVHADLVIRPDQRSVTRAGESIALTASEFDILYALLVRPGRVYTRAQLLDRVEAYGGVGLERTIDAHVRNIRRKLGDDVGEPRYVATVVGVGYKAP